MLYKLLVMTLVVHHLRLLLHPQANESLMCRVLSARVPLLGEARTSAMVLSSSSPFLPSHWCPSHRRPRIASRLPHLVLLQQAPHSPPYRPHHLNSLPCCQFVLTVISAPSSLFQHS